MVWLKAVPICLLVYSTSWSSMSATPDSRRRCTGVWQPSNCPIGSVCFLLTTLLPHPNFHHSPCPTSSFFQKACTYRMVILVKQCHICLSHTASRLRIKGSQPPPQNTALCRLQLVRSADTTLLLHHPLQLHLLQLLHQLPRTCLLNSHSQMRKNSRS